MGPPRARADVERDEVDLTLAEGREFTNSLGMRFVRVKAGTFTMGSPKGEKDRRDDEEQHEVEITRDFYLGVYEVTQKQYREVTGKNPSFFCKDGDGKDQVKGLDTDDFPVEFVTWHDAQDFLKRLNERAAEVTAGRKHRLPTEAEWEYACRGGRLIKDKKKAQLPFHFETPSASLGSGQANFDARFPYGGGKKGDFLARTNTVGKNGKPNALGLYDMHGNVWEWCSDWHDPRYYATSPARDPLGPEKGSRRVNRGGSWRYLAHNCRAAFRNADIPASKFVNMGFRVAAVMRE
jgi:formylglycine-generating enzyme required for sulfatase activity